ncbi:MAG: ABC transporter substrate-binding protein [Candidatus Limnocylindrales bacterium]
MAGRHRIRASVAICAIAVGAALGSGGGAIGQSPAAPADIEDLSFAIAGNPPSMFVPNAWTTGTGTVMSLVQEGLLAFGQDLALAPGVADSWEAPDATTFVFHLRPGVTFSDGTPVTAEDVVFSLELNRDPRLASPMAFFYVNVDTITATADDEITVTLTKPDATFPYTAAHMAGFIFQKAQYEATPEDPAAPGTRPSFGSPDVLPIGTGPYKLVSFTPGESVVLEANDAYWGGRPNVRNLTINIIADEQARLLALQDGTLDGSFYVPIGQADQWEQTGATVLSVPALAIQTLTMNVTKPPFDDIHARRAMWYLPDREGIVQAVLQGRGRAANAINPPEMWAGVLTPEEVTEFYGTLLPPEFSIEKAREELAQSATPDGFTVDLKIPADSSELSQVAQSLAANAAQVGITINVQAIDGNQFFTDYYAHEDSLSIYGYSPDFADPSNYPFLFLHSANAVPGGLNGSVYTNDAVDAAIDTALGSLDTAERAEVLKAALTQVNEDVPIVPLYWADVAAAIGPDYQWDGFTAFWYNQPWLFRGFTTR